MECPKCGKENDNKMSFCGYCGTPLNNTGSQDVVVPQDFRFQDDDGDGIPDDLPKELKLVKDGPDKTQEIKEEIKEFEEKKEDKPIELVKIKEETPKEKPITKKSSSEKIDLKKTTELIIMIILVILFIIVLFGTLKERGIL